VSGNGQDGVCGGLISRVQSAVWVDDVGDVISDRLHG